jgi:hypothetical protein
MSAEETTGGRWELTDEEWCELCFMVVDLDAARAQLEGALLAEERPTLHQLWQTMSTYRTASEDVLGYMAERLRIKAGIDQRRAA